MWSLGFGLIFRQIPIPTLAENTLTGLAWGALYLALILIGMRLSQLRSWGKIKLATVSLSIKMLLVPLVLGMGLWLLGIRDGALLTIVLEMGMPPAFATLVIAEVYDLDRELAVTALAVGSMGLLVTLPIWLFLFRF